MDSEKHPDFFFFGGGRVGHERGRDRWTAQKERELCPPLLLSRASQVQSPSITSQCAAVNACCGYRQSSFHLGGERMGI